MPALLRSILAVLIGFITIGVLAVGAGAIATKVWPASFGEGGLPLTATMQVVQLMYVGVFAIFGCWLTGRLAPAKPMTHALVVGVLGLALNIASALPVRTQVPGWYLVLGVLTTLLWAWLGGLLASRGASPVVART